MNALVTKTDYVKSRDCIKKAWLAKHRPDLGAPNSISDLLRMETGRRVGELARAMHPEGVFGSSREDSPESAVGRTISLIERNQPVIFEARLEAAGCLAKVDILRKTPDGWAIDEVKSGTCKPPDKVKADHISDVAFQMAIAEAMTVPVSMARVVAIDKYYVWNGESIEPNKLLKATEVTDRCTGELPQIQEEIPRLADLLNRPIKPEVETNTHCKGCGFYDYCHQNQPRFDVVFLPGIRSKQVTELRSEGFGTIDRIPQDHKVLTESRKNIHEATVTGKPYISSELGAALSELRFPAAFIDYETFAPAIPIYPGTRPYQSLCFQWSAHLMATAASEPTHREFLAEGSTDPRAEFCETLWDAIKDYRSIVHYSDFEINQVKWMAEAEIPYAAELYEHLLANTFDLYKIVKDYVCYAEFLGRTSIKVVLPVLVPSLSYKELEIGDGGAASAAYFRIATLETSEGERTKLQDALLAYCKQDTLAMVEIWKALQQLAH